MKKVLVLGFDGLDPQIAEAMLAAGELPNLASLQSAGGYNRLETTYPAQTPVAWSTFSTGTNPGGHGIFDFLSRDPKTYLPVLALSRYEQKNAFVPPKVVNGRRGTPMWELLTNAGIASTIIRCPCTYPPDKIKGRMLAGVGVPDLRGGLGTGTFYTTSDDVEADHNERVIRLTYDGRSPVTTQLIGPRNPKTRADLGFEITLHPDLSARKLVLRSEGQPDALEIKEGRWSGWLRVKFKAGMLSTVQGTVRFYLQRLEPRLELYASPVNFDPAAPLFPISYPENYAGELQARMGNFYTTGMAEDHDGLNNGRFDEAAFLNQCKTVLREREKMMLYELERFDEGLFFCLFDTPDRLQHMMWRFREPNHPSNQNGFSEELRRAVEDHYRACDTIVGEALDAVDERTLFIVLSDHGINSFKRGLNLNTWLYENGFLALKNGGRPGKENGEFFQNVDWARTSAYALGLGTIYLNLRGREEQGIVSTEDSEGIKTAIVKGLSGLRDIERGEVAVRSVVTREQIYRGPYTTEAPDLLVNFSEGYRVSWDTPLGGIPDCLFEDNTRRWGGDHVIDPCLVPGVLWMNRPFAAERANLVDLAPTILATLGVPKGQDMEGRNLLQ
jgi:predicted AlkP superfamily phosphohydrolase/phosphomutase